MSVAHEDRVRRWFEAMGSGDFDTMREMMHDDVEFWTSPSARSGGIVGREECLGRVERVFTSGRYYEPGSFRCAVQSILGDGDETATWVVMSARFPNGNAYENPYIVWQRWQDGLLTYNFELFDAAHWSNQRNP